MNRQFHKLVLFLVLLGPSLSAGAQVTIGVGEKPNKGALLDLKEYTDPDKTTSNKGLLLPRVNLTNLKPAGPDGLPLSIGNTDGESWNLEDHIGLVVYNVNKCIGGDQIPLGSYVWSGTEWQYLGIDDSETLASGVSKHPAKPGVYEEFYSADFGTAGIWMTTNLTAYKYDGNRHSTDPGDGTATPGVGNSRTLDGPNANPYVGGVEQYNTAYWSYPKPAGVVIPGESAPPTWDSRQGLLYTWDAATAGKGGINGQGNIYNTSGGTGANNESGYPEGTGTQQQEQIQGICPDGWHLPSDWEWTELERAIIRNKDKYSSATLSTGTDLDNELAGVSQPPSAGVPGVLGWRGLTTSNSHGNAMKSPCPVPSSPIGTTNGLSKPVKQNGFELLLAGLALNGSANSYGSYSYFWSASSYNSYYAWYRYVDSGNSQVRRDANPRFGLFSVRCKKD
jgi:hypothetical protein